MLISRHVSLHEAAAAAEVLQRSHQVLYIKSPWYAQQDGSRRATSRWVTKAVTDTASVCVLVSVQLMHMHVCFSLCYAYDCMHVFNSQTDRCDLLSAGEVTDSLTRYAGGWENCTVIVSERRHDRLQGFCAVNSVTAKQINRLRLMEMLQLREAGAVQTFTGPFLRWSGLCLIEIFLVLYVYFCWWMCMLLSVGLWDSSAGIFPLTCFSHSCLKTRFFPCITNELDIHKQGWVHQNRLLPPWLACF